MRGTRRLWACVLCLVAFSLAGYLAGVAGVFDAVLIEPSRPAMLKRVDAAASRRPADVALLVEALRGPDPLVGESAAARLERLSQAGELTEEQSELAQRALLGLLGKQGNWWRFGWDSDEPERGGFRGAVIAALASFGAQALPDLVGVLEEGGPSAREDACWVGVQMLRNDAADEQTLSSVLGQRAGELSRVDSDAGVRAACGRLDRLLGSGTMQ